MFSSLIGAKGKDVLYIGDHIFGDILKSKKTRGWRTFLVVPEMTQELYVWTTKRHLIDQLQALELQLSEAYLDMDSTSMVAPETSEVRNQIQVKMMSNRLLALVISKLLLRWWAALMLVCDFVLICQRP